MNGIHEVEGSNPFRSTSTCLGLRAILSSLTAAPLTGCFGGPCISASDAIIFTILFVGTVAFVGFALVAFFA